MAQNITTQDFKDKVFDFAVGGDWKFKGERPAIIDFYADWCGPCKMVAPILEDLSKDYDGKLDIYKINTEEEQELAGAFGIQSIPSILFIPNEGQPQMAQGAMSKDGFVKAIEDILEVK